MYSTIILRSIAFSHSLREFRETNVTENYTRTIHTLSEVTNIPLQEDAMKSNGLRRSKQL